MKPFVEIYSKRFWRLTEWKTEWRFRIKASNGRILASGEGYTRKSNCLKAVSTILSMNPLSEVRKV